MKKHLKNIATVAFLVLVLVMPYIVLAQTAPLNKMKDMAPEAGFAAVDRFSMVDMVGVAINAVLGLLGVIFLVLILLAGFNWMTARGDESKVTKAKDIITRAIVGLIIIVGSYAISEFVFGRLLS